jgi:glycosyltransferase involved in cell wall biosynthesis
VSRWNDHRTPVLYLAPWVDIGGSDKGTVDWFRSLDRDRFRPSLITTQPSLNRRLRDVTPYAHEVWDLPEMMEGDGFPRFILTFIRSRRVEVVHIMNSRLGFELLPEIANLPDPPAVVVQLHVEEDDQSGYVRYVTTRYGTLVDAFSVTSQALSDRLDAYEVPHAKRRVIRTGVDAEREFSPDRVAPAPGLRPGIFHVLYPARLTAQKDPLLMVEIAARLRAMGVDFQIHVLGDGELGPELRERIDSRGLSEQVLLYGDRTDIAPWYAACDAVLLTSEFEGLPYVAYEALAMATPLVGPRLSGLAELVTHETGILVSPREDVSGYADAIARLAADPAWRSALGRAGRHRALDGLSLRQMAAEHEILYDELLEPRRRRPVAADQAGDADHPAPRHAVTGALRDRRPGERPLVSVIVPCFNHGWYLDECLQSIAEQDYEPREVIIVDDGSTDPATLERLSRIEREGTATVLRQDVNRGPSAARNAAMTVARGRYVLPVDADNLLLPGAIAMLVDQLSAANERVGFIYPNLQYFGNRTDYFEAPSYNLHSLLGHNYCDTSSLIDREVFDRGFRYPDDIVHGHEDWDLVLSLAEHGIYGEAANGRSLLYRKHGFTRSDLVNDAGQPFRDIVADRHPQLFDSHARVRIKGEWNPALSVIAVDPLEELVDNALSALIGDAVVQSCADFEVVLRTGHELGPTLLGPRLRRIPAALARSRGEALRQGLETSRGRWVLAVYGAVSEVLADPGLVEKTLRILATGVDALAFADVGAGVPPIRLLDAARAREATLGALCWSALDATAPPPSLELDADDPLEMVARWLSSHSRMQWRQLDRRMTRAGDGGLSAGVRRETVGEPRLARPRDAHPRRAAPELADGTFGVSTRMRPDWRWIPPQTRLLCRHRDLASGRYRYTNLVVPLDDGWQFDRVLGCLRGVPLPGTYSLIERCGASDGDPAFALGLDADLDASDLLGFVEQVHLPLLEPLRIGRLRATGQHVLIAGEDDPLAAEVEQVETIGFIEPHPVHPAAPPHVDASYGLVGLVRTVDHAARRHRYGIGAIPAGQLSGELGALFDRPVGDCIPVWSDSDGHLTMTGLNGSDRRPSAAEVVRWAGEPLTWRGFSTAGPKIRGTARRAYDATRLVLGARNGEAHTSGAPSGFLARTAAGRHWALYGAVHPVTGDQLLSTSTSELDAMGYVNSRLLGYLAPSAPVTGVPGVRRVGVPWALRFGLTSGA